METTLTLAILAFTTGFSAAQAQTVAVSKAEAAELGVHRIERLIALNKIEKDFGSKLESVSVMPMPATTDADVAFMVTATQFVIPGATAESVLLNLNNAGKLLSFTATQDGNQSTTAAFPDKDAATCLELGLHKLEADAADPAAAPFYNDMSSVKLVPVMMDMNGTAMMSSVNVVITSTAVTTTLTYQMALDGTITGRNIQ